MQLRKTLIDFNNFHRASLKAPIIAAILPWTRLYRMGSWLLLSSMTGAILFGIYNHFIVISPDHVSHVSFEGWGLLFQITAILTLIVDGFGSGLAYGH